jgi:hypothetical protein
MIVQMNCSYNEPPPIFMRDAMISLNRLSDPQGPYAQEINYWGNKIPNGDYILIEINVGELL